MHFSFTNTQKSLVSEGRISQIFTATPFLDFRTILWSRTDFLTPFCQAYWTQKLSQKIIIFSYYPKFTPFLLFFFLGGGGGGATFLWLASFELEKMSKRLLWEGSWGLTQNPKHGCSQTSGRAGPGAAQQPQQWRSRTPSTSVLPFEGLPLIAKSWKNLIGLADFENALRFNQLFQQID